MSIESINTEITNCRNKISSNTSEISTLQNKISQMEQVYSNLSTSQNNFLEHLEVKQGSFENLYNSFGNTKFALECASECIEFLTGSEAQNANNSLDEAKHIVNQKINGYSDDIDDLKSNNTYLRSRIEELNQLKKRLSESGV